MACRVHSASWRRRSSGCASMCFTACTSGHSAWRTCASVSLPRLAATYARQLAGAVKRGSRRTSFSGATCEVCARARNNKPPASTVLGVPAHRGMQAWHTTPSPCGAVMSRQGPHLQARQRGDSSLIIQQPPLVTLQRRPRCRASPARNLAPGSAHTAWTITPPRQQGACHGACHRCGALCHRAPRQSNNRSSFATT